MRQKAGFKTPATNEARTVGTGINPGSDDEETDDDDEVIELQGGGQIASPEEEAEEEEAEEENVSNSVSIDHLTKELEDKLTMALRGGKLKGFFVQNSVPDPDDPKTIRQRVCVFALMPSGVSFNDIEVDKNGSTVAFHGPHLKESVNAKHLLGLRGRVDGDMVRQLQAQIDDIAGVRGIEFRESITVDKKHDLEPGFVDPRTNRIARDPIFLNRIRATNPKNQVDLLICTSFLLVRRKREGYARRGGERRREFQVDDKFYDSDDSQGWADDPMDQDSVRSPQRPRTVPRNARSEPRGIGRPRRMSDRDMRPRRMDYRDEGYNRRHQGQSSGSRRRRTYDTDENSPRVRQHLNDGSVVESSYEVNRSYEDNDVTGPETVSENDEEEAGESGGFFSRFGR